MDESSGHLSSPTPATTLDTTHFWQRIESAADWQARMLPPYRHSVPVMLPGGTVLELPIRALPQEAGKTGRAVASQ